MINKKDQTTIRVEKDTRKKLIELKYKYNFSSMDSLILGLIKNTKILRGDKDE